MRPHIKNITLVWRSGRSHSRIPVAIVKSNVFGTTFKYLKDGVEKAKEEGFDRIAFLFEAVAEIEKEHEARYRKLLENVENGLVFSKDGDKVWQCRNCGHIVIGREAPEVCPVCSHPKAYFEVKNENYM